ncbi:hypothetical protein ACOSQ2_023100 [Xanthoceras sorbifolium]
MEPVMPSIIVPRGHTSADTGFISSAEVLITTVTSLLFLGSNWIAILISLWNCTVLVLVVCHFQSLLTTTTTTTTTTTKSDQTSDYMYIGDELQR